MVTRDELLRKLSELPPERFEQVAPFIEADLAAADDLAGLHREIEAGRRSAASEPLLPAQDVYARVRKALSR